MAIRPLKDEVDSITDFLISNKGNLTAFTQLLLCRNIHNLLTYIQNYSSASTDFDYSSAWTD